MSDDNQLNDSLSFTPEREEGENWYKVKSPTNMPMDEGRAGEWQIVRKSLPVVGGAEHNYLALEFVPEGGAVEPRSELHGVNYDPSTGQVGQFTLGKNHNLIAIAAKPGEHWGNAQTGKSVVLAHGSHESIVGGYWHDAMQRAADFNNSPDGPAIYDFGEQNSNNFNHSMIRHIGLGDRSGSWDGNSSDYGASGFNYNPGQWNVTDVLANPIRRNSSGADRLLEIFRQKGPGNAGDHPA